MGRLCQATFLLLACTVGPGKTFPSSSNVHAVDSPNSFLHVHGKQITCCCDASGSLCHVVGFQRRDQPLQCVERALIHSRREIPKDLEKNRHDSISFPWAAGKAGLQGAIPSCGHNFLQRWKMFSESWQPKEELTRSVTEKRIGAHSIHGERMCEDALGQCDDVLQGMRSGGFGMVSGSSNCSGLRPENFPSVSHHHDARRRTGLGCHHDFAASPLLLRLRGSGRAQRNLERKTASVRDNLVLVS
jgi:hypothetical protein